MSPMLTLVALTGSHLLFGGWKGPFCGSRGTFGGFRLAFNGGIVQMKFT